MFLPDRYVKGTCPNCGTPDQYGDACENCGATYSPPDLIDPSRRVSGTAPVRASPSTCSSSSADFDECCALAHAQGAERAARAQARRMVQGGTCRTGTSRATRPTSASEIPGEPGKYFYVWLDAPIGYLAQLFDTWRRANGRARLRRVLGRDSEPSVYHFIGKDIVYFHTLFWPAMLQGAGTASRRRVRARLPHRQRQKMSKSRGTFITAARYLANLIDPSTSLLLRREARAAADDIDLNLDDFVAKVNSDLVGKLVNIASRAAGARLYAEFAAAADDLAADFEQREYSRAVRKIMALAGPGESVHRRQEAVDHGQGSGQRGRGRRVHAGLNLFRALIVYLKPIVPALAARAEALLAGGELRWHGRRRTAARNQDREVRSAADARRARHRRIADETRTYRGQCREHTDSDATPQANGEIDLKEFQKTELRVARVIEASYVEGADKLLKLKLDVGNEERTVFSGIRSSYEPAALTNRLVILVANLAPRKMRFGVSQGMVLAASGDEPGIFLLSPDSGAKPGMKVS